MCEFEITNDGTTVLFWINGKVGDPDQEWFLLGRFERPGSVKIVKSWEFGDKAIKGEYTAHQFAAYLVGVWALGEYAEGRIDDGELAGQAIRVSLIAAGFAA